MVKTHAISLRAGSRQCPLCGSEDVARSHRHGVLEWTILPLLLLRPFRCRECCARHLGFFFRRRRWRHAASGTAGSIEDLRAIPAKDRDLSPKLNG
jgi:hypothetical protein